MCNILGTWVENGEYPRDMKRLEAIASGIAYYNAKDYFGF
jgi:glucuronate isomerase